ncbi:metallophosphoesterase [Stenotrophomonas phage BUCTxx99]|nr:metallophosphoesterase [Stenotrophomonas phage BUCTxx99]
MSKPILIFSDPHYHDFTQFSTINAKGLNSRLADTLRATAEAYKHLQSLEGKHAICAGDIFHVRGKVKPSVLNPTSEMFRKLQFGAGLHTYAISGNHDLETDSSSALNSSITALRDVGMNVWSDGPGSAIIDEATVTFVPWEPDLKKLRKYIATQYPAHPTRPSALVIHAPLNGVIKGLPDHGLTPDDFKDCKYDKVFIGHYHNHKSFTVGKCEVISVGALTHQNFGDVNNLAGYLMWYPDTGEVKHFTTKAPRFMHVEADRVGDLIPSAAADNYVKVVNGVFESDAEIQAIKDELILKGAKAVVVEGVTKRPAVTRGSTSGTAAPTIHSILGDYVTRTYPGDDAVLAEAMDILNEVYV